MTIEMQEMLEKEMDDALALTDADRRHDAMLTVLAHQSRALVDCQRKTSDRVKQLVDDVAEIKEDLAPCVESDKTFRRMQTKAEGAAILWRVLRYLAAAGGGAGLLKLLSTAS